MMSVPVRHGLRLKLLAVLVAACYGSAHANPGNPQVVAGQASFLQQGNLYTITNTPNAIINWQNFSISPNEITRFIQQSGDSKVLNRIVGQDPSKILGSLQSNGKVYLINPNGVLFGKDARVDVNGLVASSLAISNVDFLAGKNRFAGDGAAKVVNQGSITTPGGGQVYLIASSVENSGVITSPQGEVVLAAGKSVQLVDSANPDVHVVVSAPSDQALNLGQVLAAGGKVGIYGALVNQRGRVSADSAAVGANGKIVLKASGTTLLEAGSRTSAVNAAGKGGEIQLLGDRVGLTDDAAVDASGAAGGGTVLIGGDYQGKNAAVQHAQQTYIGERATVRADATQQGDGGKVVAWSDGATRVYGSLSARGGAQGGDGGMLETSGKYLDMQGQVDTRAPKGKVGSLLLDPTNITIGTATLGGVTAVDRIFAEAGSSSDSAILASTLADALVNADITVSTASSGSGTGNITVDSIVSWGSGNSLTLDAAGGIALNAPITAAGAPVILKAAAGNIQQASAGAITAASLVAQAGGGITLDAANIISGSATLAASGGNALLHAASVNLGASSASGTLTAVATDGGLAVSGAVSSSGNLALSATQADAGITISSGASIASSAGDISLKADRMALNGALTATTQHGISLEPNSATTNISVGGTSADGSNVLGLSADDLANVQLPANGWLSIGVSSGANTLTVAGDLNLTTGQNNGSLLLQTQTGALNIVTGADLAATGAISLQTVPSGSNTISNSGTVTSASGINLFSGRMVLAGGTLTAPSVSLGSGNNIDLGGTAPVTDTLTLSAADLASVTPTAALYVSVNSSHNGTGDIVASAPLSYAGALTLGAQRNIDLQSSVTAGGLTLNTPGTISASGAVAVSGTFLLAQGSWTQEAGSLPAFSAADFRIAAGAAFLRTTGGYGNADLPYNLIDVYGLQGIASLNSGFWYSLSGEIVASGTSGWNDGSGFAPIGSATSPFLGGISGYGNSISGLYINRPTTSNVGLFAYLGGSINNLTLSDASVTGGSNVGGVFGNTSDSSGNLYNVHSSGMVSGVGNVGGLGGSSGAQIIGSSSSGAVIGRYAASYASNIGGLVGYNFGDISTSHSLAGVSTTGQGYAGGLVGANASESRHRGSISSSYAAGNVSSSGEIVGGLVGDNAGGTISASYATGAVLGGRNVGGLAGRNSTGGSDSGVLTDVYASGTVGAHSAPTLTADNMGGLLGENLSGTVSRAFSSSVISGGGFAHVNGLVGFAGTGTVSQGYFNSVNAGTSADSSGGLALTPTQMMQQASFTGFDFTGVANEVPATWRIYPGHTTPLLKSMLTPLAVTVVGSGITKVYDGASAAFDSTGSTYSVAGAIVDGALGWDGAKNVGSYGIGGLYSTQYDISYLGSSPVLQITPAQLTAQVGGSKVYDGGTSFTNPTVTLAGVLAGDAVTGVGSATFLDKHAGAGKTVNVVSVELAGTDAGNYQLPVVPLTGTATITQAPLTVSGIVGVSRVYDRSVGASVTGTLAATGVAGDDITAVLAGSGYTFGDRAVGEGKPINVPLTLSGGDAANYLPYTSTTGSITAAPLTITGLSGVDRIYDATTIATLSGGTLGGVISGDTVQLGAVQGNFTGLDAKNVGSNKPIVIESTPTLSGTDSGNYYVVGSYPNNLTANVTQATLTVSGISADSRVYNGSTSATLSVEGGQLYGKFSQDEVSINAANYSAAFADRNVGTGKTVTVSGLALTGADAANYTFAAPTLSADITQLGKVTWTGSAGNNLWSDVGNWYGGAVPVGSNVLTAELGLYGGELIYDAGNTTLNSLTGIHITPLTVNVNGGTLAIGTISTTNGMGLTLAGGALALGTAEGAASSLAGGTLTINSGSLNLGGALSAGSYVQSGGALSGAGALNTGNFHQSGGAITGLSALNVNSNYSYSGGTVLVPGSVSIHQTTGNLTVGPITAQEGIALSVGMSEGAGAGASIAQSGALRTAELTVSSQGGVTLNNSANHVLHVSGSNYGSGGISLYNTLSGSDQLGVGSLSTSGGNIAIDNVGGIYTELESTQSAAGGMVSLTAHSPITINSTLLADSVALSASTGIALNTSSSIQTVNNISMTAGTDIQLAGTLQSSSGGISVLSQTGSISADSAMTISGAGAVTLSATLGSISAPASIFQGGSTPVINDGAAAAAAAAAAKAAADAAAAQAAAEAAAKAAADAAAKAAADAAAKAAADAAAEAAAKAAAEAAAKAAADAAAQAAAEAAAKAAADAAAKAAADAAAEAAAEAAAKAAADAAAQAAAAEAAVKAAAEAAAKAAADAAAAEAAAKAAQDAAAQAAAEAAAKAAQDEAAAAAAEAAARAAAEAAAKAAADAAAKAAADAAAKAAADANQTQPNQPVGQALNATVNIINTAVTTAKESGVAPAVVAAVTAKDKEDPKAAEAAKEEKKDGIASKDVAVKKDEPVKKLYCN